MQPFVFLQFSFNPVKPLLLIIVIDECYVDHTGSCWVLLAVFGGKKIIAGILS